MKLTRERRRLDRRTPKVSTEQMLVSGEKFWMGGAGISGDGNLSVDVEGYWREADFIVAGLVVELQRDVLGPKGGVGLHGEGDAKNYFVGVDIEGSLGEGEGFEFALGVGDFAGGFETGGKSGAEVGRDEVLGGGFAGVDVEARTDFEDDGELEVIAAGDRFEGSVGEGRNDFTAGGNLGMGGG